MKLLNAKFMFSSDVFTSRSIRPVNKPLLRQSSMVCKWDPWGPGPTWINLRNIC